MTEKKQDAPAQPSEVVMLSQEQQAVREQARINAELGASGIRHDETVPGGYYIGTDGQPHDAEGRPIKKMSDSQLRKHQVHPSRRQDSEVQARRELAAKVDTPVLRPGIPVNTTDETPLIHGARPTYAGESEDLRQPPETEEDQGEPSELAIDE